LNFELFIARKIRSGGFSGKKLAGPVIKVATLGIVLGMVVMILSLAIGFGFKREIRDKITGFGSHIQIMSYDYNYSYETNPITKDSTLKATLQAMPGITKIQAFGTKPGIIKTNDAMQGIVLKGIDASYDWTFMKSILTHGRTMEIKDTVRSDEILISDELASMLHLKLGDDVRMYFFQSNILARKFKIVGIYDSHFPEYDKLFALVDLRHVQKLNDWDETQISGYEITVDSFDNLDKLSKAVDNETSTYISEDGGMLRTKSIKQIQPQIFGWLDLLDLNMVVILVLIVLVAGFNMISGLLILILERTNMIGILKALGAGNNSLRRVFLYLSAYILGRGLLWGNLIGIGLCLIQKYTQVIQLDASNYYLETVPIYITPLHIVLLNICVISLTMLMMLGPSYLVSRISPVKAIRFN